MPRRDPRGSPRPPGAATRDARSRGPERSFSPGWRALPEKLHGPAHRVEITSCLSPRWRLGSAALSRIITATTPAPQEWLVVLTGLFAVAVTASTFLSITTGQRQILLDVNVLGTSIHEAGHALVSCLTGGGVYRFTILGPGSGLVHTWYGSRFSDIAGDGLVQLRVDHGVQRATVVTLALRWGTGWLPNLVAYTRPGYCSPYRPRRRRGPLPIPPASRISFGSAAGTPSSGGESRCPVATGRRAGTGCRPRRG
ncbi:M50 family metallopeptidase [Amycolatopsis ruanii]|uniref:M50 family metallopeptidase n=1 Tax=Amycolatopsis TaxID=1813 RepID=UPI000E23D96A